MPKQVLAACFAFAVLILAGSQGCVKDHCTQTYKYFVPVYRTSEQVRANIKSNAPIAIERAGKLYIRGSYIFLNEIDKNVLDKLKNAPCLCTLDPCEGSETGIFVFRSGGCLCLTSLAWRGASSSPSGARVFLLRRCI